MAERQLCKHLVRESGRHDVDRLTQWTEHCLLDGKAWAVTLRAGSYDVTDCDIRGISEDRNGNIWLATDNEGILCLPATKKKMTRINVVQYASRNNNLAVNDATKVYEDRHGRLWAISNSGGLFLLDRKTNVFAPKNHAFHIPGDRVLAIAEDQSDNLWLSTDEAIVRLPRQGR